MLLKFLLLGLFVWTIGEVSGHGMMLEPPNRSSLWRYYNNTPINYDDNQNYCGGKPVQWEQLGGKCGLCGDRYDYPHPQDNENTGKYGIGLVVREYESGSQINVTIMLTSNHLGHFLYSLCVLDDPTKPEPGEGCFDDLLLADGNPQYNVTGDDMLVSHFVMLPYGLKCDRCVLRWHYTAGNTWGRCEDGSFADGCGPQENFRSCADVAIV